MSYETR